MERIGHAALRPDGLRAIAQGMGRPIDELTVQALTTSPDVPEWVRLWVVRDVLPTITVGMESLRVAAAAIESLTPPKPDNHG